MRKLFFYKLHIYCSCRNGTLAFSTAPFRFFFSCVILIVLYNCQSFLTPRQISLKSFSEMCARQLSTKAIEN